MPNDQRTSSLPENDDFWKAVDNGPTREYYNTCVIELIRNFNGKSDIERIEFIAKAKLLVELLDNPSYAWQSIALQKLEQQEKEQLENVL